MKLDLTKKEMLIVISSVVGIGTWSFLCFLAGFMYCFNGLVD